MSLPARTRGRREGPPGVYQGKDYLAVAELPLDPLVHQDPHRPSRAYRQLTWLAWHLLRLLFRLRVEGLENIPAPPFIIAANHTAWYDSVFIIATFARQTGMPMVYTMARRDTVFNRGWRRWLLPRFGVFPVRSHQGHLDEGAVATFYQLLARGAVVLIFPEGGYSRGRQLRPLRKGVGHFALQAGVPICPVGVAGLDRLRPFARVSVSIAPAVRPDPPGWWDLNRRVFEVIDRVRRAIVHTLEPDSAGRSRGRLARGWARISAPLRIRLRRGR